MIEFAVQGLKLKDAIDLRTLKYRNALISECIEFLVDREDHYNPQNTDGLESKSSLSPTRNYQLLKRDRARIKIIWHTMCKETGFLKESGKENRNSSEKHDGNIEKSFLLIFDGQKEKGFTHKRNEEALKADVVDTIQDYLGVLTAIRDINNFKLRSYSESLEKPKLN